MLFSSFLSVCLILAYFLIVIFLSLFIFLFISVFLLSVGFFILSITFFFLSFVLSFLSLSLCISFFFFLVSASLFYWVSDEQYFTFLIFSVPFLLGIPCKTSSGRWQSKSRLSDKRSILRTCLERDNSRSISTPYMICSPTVADHLGFFFLSLPLAFSPPAWVMHDRAWVNE